MSQSCSDNLILYQNTHKIPSDQWAYSDKITGTWIQDNTLSDVSIVLDLSHSLDFGYQNLYLTGQLRKDNQMVWSDTFSIQFARPNSGLWIGSKIGDYVRISDTIPYTLSLEPGEHLGYRFSQFSREEVLMGIEEVKVRFIGN